MSVEDRRVLNSWKEIAQYLGRGVRTIQRYEQEFKLPVRRIAGRRRTAVIAFSDEIDSWLEGAVKNSDLPLSNIREASTRAMPSAANADAGRTAPKLARKANRLPNVMIVEDHVERVDELRAVLDSLGPSKTNVFSARR